MRMNFKLLLCMTLTLTMASCNNTKTYKLTYVYGDSRTTIKVKSGEVVEELPSIETKTGYDAYWAIDGKQVNDGLVYDYGEDKEAVLVYVPHTWKIIFDNDEHTRINVTYGQTIGTLPAIPPKTGYKNGVWKIEDTIITSSTIYNWDKDTLATLEYDKESYILSFEGLSEDNNIQIAYNTLIGALPAVPEYTGDIKEHFVGYWSIDNEMINENTIWKYEKNKVAKPVYKAFSNDLENGATINVMSSIIQELYDAKEIIPSSDGGSLLEVAKKYINKENNLTNISYKLSWSEVKPFEYSIVSVSDNINFQNAKKYVTYNHYINLIDLKMNTTYYYQIEGVDGKYSVLSDIYNFNVSDGARIMSIDGVENFRDIGSYQTTIENKKIKQNMIYRSGNADGITTLGKKQIKELYNLKTELDLREKAYWTNQSYFGKDVQYKHVSNEQGGVYYIDRGVDLDQTGLATGGATIRDELLTFVDSNNYPINFHCAIGRDRTGTLAMLLLGLLGVSEADICFDYVISLINGNAKAKDEIQLLELYNNIYQTMQYIKNLTGQTKFDEAVKTYLTTNFVGSNVSAKVGLTNEQVDSIKNIMLEDK